MDLGSAPKITSMLDSALKASHKRSGYPFERLMIKVLPSMDVNSTGHSKTLNRVAFEGSSIDIQILCVVSTHRSRV